MIRGLKCKLREKHYNLTFGKQALLSTEHAVLTIFVSALKPSKTFKVTNRGTQLGDVLSTSQVANNFIGTGLWGVDAIETSRRIPPTSAILSRSHIVVVNYACALASNFR